MNSLGNSASLQSKGQACVLPIKKCVGSPGSESHLEHIHYVWKCHLIPFGHPKESWGLGNQ